MIQLKSVVPVAGGKRINLLLQFGLLLGPFPIQTPTVASLSQMLSCLSFVTLTRNYLLITILKRGKIWNKEEIKMKTIKNEKKNLKKKIEIWNLPKKKKLKSGFKMIKDKKIQKTH